MYHHLQIHFMLIWIRIISQRLRDFRQCLIVNLIVKLSKFHYKLRSRLRWRIIFLKLKKKERLFKRFRELLRISLIFHLKCQILRILIWNILLSFIILKLNAWTKKLSELRRRIQNHLSLVASSKL